MHTCQKDSGKQLRHEEIRMYDLNQPIDRHGTNCLKFDFALQRGLADRGGVIMDGRDIGTVVMPDADVKIYLTASSEVRARRRVLELEAKGEKPDFEDVKREIEERDYRDMHREISPLKQADDAVLVDTSDMTIDEVVAKICSVCG